eukprot:3505590-Prymnesium_polylepis.1
MKREQVVSWTWHLRVGSWLHARSGRYSFERQRGARDRRLHIHAWPWAGAWRGAGGWYTTATCTSAP